MSSQLTFFALLLLFNFLYVDVMSFSFSSSGDARKNAIDGEGKRRNFEQGLKLLSNPLFPFLVIHVRPNPCKGKDGLEGVCQASQNCTMKGGKAYGTCANGFGVCCLLEHRCGAIVKANNSILVNNEYPKTFDGVGNCQYIIDKISDDICQLRIDFEVLSLSGPNEDSSLCEEDTFSVVGTAGGNPKVICGLNSGQHMYLDLAIGSGSARINIATTSIGKQRTWKLNVAQISCNSLYRAPQNCLQYFTEYSGTIRSFNYQPTDGVHHIGGLSYAVCVSAREGYCGITYQSNSFSVSGNATEIAEALSGDENCDQDFVSIFVQDKTGTVSTDRYCGTGFNDTTTYSKPFEIRVISDESEPSTDVDNQGFLLKYMQIPC